jgi:hypothetical protein
MNEVLRFFEGKRVPFRYAFIPEKTEDFDVQGCLIIFEWRHHGVHEAVDREIYAAIVGGRRGMIGTGSTNFVIEGIITQADGDIHPKELQPGVNNLICGTADGQAFPNIVWEVHER